MIGCWWRTSPALSHLKRGLSPTLTIWSTERFDWFCIAMRCACWQHTCMTWMDLIYWTVVGACVYVVSSSTQCRLAQKKRKRKLLRQTRQSFVAIFQRYTCSTHMHSVLPPSAWIGFYCFISANDLVRLNYLFPFFFFFISIMQALKKEKKVLKKNFTSKGQPGETFTRFAEVGRRAGK